MDFIISKYFFFFSLLLKPNDESIIRRFSAFEESKKIEYTWWSRLWRIYKFLKRSRKKRKQEQRQEKNKKQSEKQKEKRFQRRKRWRKFKVVIKSFLRKGKRNPKLLEAKRHKKVLKQWERRKRRRIFKAFVMGMFKPAPKNKRHKEYLKRLTKEQEFATYRKKRIYRFLVKRYTEILKDVLRGKGFPKRKKKRGVSIWKQIWYPKQLAITINSLMFFLLSYFFIAFFDKLSMGITSMLFDYKIVIYYYNIEFLVDYDDWFADAVKTIFASGPVVGLLIALLSLIVYSMIYLETGILKTLLLWSIFHGFNRIINGTLVGSMIGKGFGYVIMYMYYSDTGKLIMSLIMISISVIIGTVSTKYWIMSANSYYNFSKPHNRPLFIINQVLLPYLFGILIIYLINLPNPVFYDNLVNIGMIFMILPVLFLNKYDQEYYFDEMPRSIKISGVLIIFTLVFLSTYRILLDFGLRMG